MHDKKCDLNELFIEQLIDSELDFNESSEVSLHIESCANCKKIYDELKFVRVIMKDVEKRETLSPIEKEGFYNMIEKHAAKLSVWGKIKTFLNTKSHFIFAFTSMSFILLTAFFIFSILNIDSSRDLIIQEIISAHDNNFPEEFSMTASEESLKNVNLKQLKVDPVVIRELAKISPVLKGRHTSIAAQPMAKIKLKDKNSTGTLLMSRKNDTIKNVFQNANCVVRYPDGKTCKATSYEQDGKEIVYWASKENEYVFVSDNRDLSSRMIRLIGSH